MMTTEPATLMCCTCLRVATVTPDNGQITVPPGWSHTRVLTAGPGTQLVLNGNSEPATDGYEVTASAWRCPHCEKGERS